MVPAYGMVFLSRIPVLVMGGFQGICSFIRVSTQPRAGTEPENVYERDQIRLKHLSELLTHLCAALPPAVPSWAKLLREKDIAGR